METNAHSLVDFLAPPSTSAQRLYCCALSCQSSGARGTIPPEFLLSLSLSLDRIEEPPLREVAIFLFTDRGQRQNIGHSSNESKMLHSNLFSRSPGGDFSLVG